MKLESLVKLQTIQMEGNPVSLPSSLPFSKLVLLQVWSNPDYCSHLVSSLPSLSTLDQQDVTMEMKGSAKR